MARLIERIGNTRNVIELNYTDNNQSVPGKNIVGLQDLLIDSWQQELVGLASKIKNGDIKALTQAGELVKKIHLSSLLKGKNGDFSAITNKDYGTVGSILKKQYYAGKGDDGKPYGLRHLFKDVSEDKISQAQLENRLRMYGNSGKISESISELNLKVEQGYQSKRRNLGIAEHCPSCIRYASFGWVGIDSPDLPPIATDCECLTNCKCSFSYSKEKRH